MKIILTFALLMVPGVLSSISMTGYLGGQVNITFNYDKSCKEKAKYFCKRQRSNCTTLNKTENQWVPLGRFSLFDNKKAAVFTVIIRDLREDDSGTYYCAVDRSTNTDCNPEVNLNVVKEHTTISFVSIVSSSSTSDFSLVSPSISNGSSVIIGMSVIVILLIIGLVSSTIVLQRRRTIPGSNSASKTPQPGTENSETVPQMPHLYEEIKDPRAQTDCRTAKLPNNASCSTVYATQQLPTNPSASCSTVYATQQLPSNAC